MNKGFTYRFYEKYIQLLCIGCIYLLPAITFGQVQIDSITTTPSTCQNNGSITVTAKNTNTAGALLYSITAGTVIEPAQTNNIFNSLPAGNYTITVSDGGANTATQSATITGNYLTPDFIPTATPPYCPNGNDGQIIGNRIAGSGNGPFTWQLISPSPITRVAQASDTFSNLLPGNYTVRLTDACGSFRTIVTTVSNQVYSNLSFVYGPIVEIVGCDSGLLTMQMNASLFRFPITYTFKTDNVTITTKTPTHFSINSNNPSSGYFTVQQWLPNFTYGNSVQITMTDSCGSTLSSSYYQARPFNFCWSLTSLFTNCAYLTSTLFSMNLPNCLSQGEMPTYADVPLKYSVVSDATNQIADSGTITGDPTHNFNDAVDGLTIKPLPNGPYRITITDACGNSWNTAYTIANATPAPPSISKALTLDGCLDSVATLVVNANNFTSDPKLILLSGPASMGSAKPGYAYHSTYVYPDTLTWQSWQGTGVGIYGFEITNLSVGTYQFKVVDTCGAAVFGSVVISPQDVNDFHNSFWGTKGCLGKNQINYSLNSSDGELSVTNQAQTYSINKSWQSVQGGSVYDSLINLSSGTYYLRYTYASYTIHFQKSMPAMVCTTIYDTITIQGYETPAISTINYIVCKGGTTIVLSPDSTKGVPPYQYEITKGPQTFPVQNSNLFSVTMPGTYTASIFDVCGNGSTAQITVDTIASPPPDRIMFACNNTTLYNNSSPYYTYTWTKPNTTIYTGDTLAINPVTAADTGIYHIQRVVNFNGCKDTSYTTYHLQLSVASSQTIPFCNGTTVTVGTNTYNTPGTYTDTFTNTLGCDSVVTTSLVVLPQKKDTNNVTICKGSSITVQGNVYNSTGFYKDSVQNNLGCYDLIFTNLTVLEFKDTINTAICNMDSLLIGSVVYKLPGIYVIDTLKSQMGCDSIILLNLIVAPPATYTVIARPDSEIICPGESYTLGIQTYNQTGTYLDTVLLNCNNYIYTVNLTVKSYKKDSIVENICAGESFTIGNGHTYTTTGIYRDTLSTTGCDSIVILNLNIGHYKQGTINATICSLDSFIVGPHVYKNPGTYIDTLSTSVTNCDSIVVLNLSVTPPIYNVIAAPVSVSFCVGDSIQIGNQYYTRSGTYQDSIPFLNCTVFVFTVNITVNPSVKDSIVKNICSGESFTVGTHTYTTTGIYYDTLYTAITACDSVVILNLTVNNYKKDSISEAICAGQSYQFNGKAYTQAGVYKDTLSTITCDSIAILNLTVNPLHIITINDTDSEVICEGDSLGFGTTLYTQSGIYQDTIVNGCTGYVLTVNVTVNPYKKDSIVQTICSGQSYLFNGNTYTRAGIYRDTLSTITCDSIVILNLTVNNYKKDSVNEVICAGQSYPFNGNVYTYTGIYRDTLSTTTCDSIAILHLTVNNYKKDSINETICAGQSFTFSGNAYTQTGIYRDTLPTVNCDSIVVLNLTVDNYKKDSINEAICAGQIFTFNGNAYTQQNIYRDTIPTTTCDSIVTLNLIVYPAPSIKIITSSTEVSKGETIQLNTTETAYSYLWTSMEMIDNNTVQDPKAIINNSVWIFLQATDDVTDCPASDSVYIFVRPGSTDSTISPCTGSYIYVPNAFTPNNDNLNDIFKPVANNITLQDFQIYNRWGQMVFETTDIHKGWNGTFQGQLADVGNYVYWLSYFDCTNTSKPKTIKGNIILIR